MSPQRTNVRVGFVNSGLRDFQGSPELVRYGRNFALRRDKGFERARGAFAGDFSVPWVADDGEGSSLRVTAEGLGRADARLFAGEAVRRVASAARGGQGEG